MILVFLIPKFLIKLSNFLHSLTVFSWLSISTQVLKFSFLMFFGYNISPHININYFFRFFSAIVHFFINTLFHFFNFYFIWDTPPLQLHTVRVTARRKQGSMGLWSIKQGFGGRPVNREMTQKRRHRDDNKENKTVASF